MVLPSPVVEVREHNLRWYAKVEFPVLGGVRCPRAIFPRRYGGCGQGRTSGVLCFLGQAKRSPL
jgi:hypothetical protein